MIVRLIRLTYPKGQSYASEECIGPATVVELEPYNDDEGYNGDYFSHHVRRVICSTSSNVPADLTDCAVAPGEYEVIDDDEITRLIAVCALMGGTVHEDT